MGEIKNEAKRRRIDNNTKASIMMLEDTPVQITLPAVDGVVGECVVYVLLAKPGEKTVNVELSRAILTYMKCVAEHR